MIYFRKYLKEKCWLKPQLKLSIQIFMNLFFNPYTLRVAKISLTVLEIFFKQRHFLDNIWMRNAYLRPNNNSPPNIFRALFPSYFWRYERRRQYVLYKYWVTNSGRQSPWQVSSVSMIFMAITLISSVNSWNIWRNCWLVHWLTFLFQIFSEISLL